MDAEMLRQTVAQAGFGVLWIGLVAGFVFSFNPVALAAIPVSLAYVTKTRTPPQAALFGGLFVLGMILNHVALGLVASLGGGWVQHLLGVASGIGSPLFGTSLLLTFALGRAIPIMLGAYAVGWLENLSVLGRFQKTFERIGAILLILSGLYMLNAYFVVVPELAV